MSPYRLPAKDRMEQVVSAGLTLSSITTLDGVLQRVVELAVRVIGAKYAAVGVLGPDNRTLEKFVTIGMDPADEARIGPRPRGHGILGLVIRNAQVVRLPDLTTHPDSYGFPPGHPPMHSFLGVPILGRNRIFGDLYLTEKLDAPEFSDEDEYIARLFASQVGAAVENARLHDESAHLLEEVQQLHRTRERFFAMVNHELRNALAATYGWAEMLVRKKDPASVPRAAFEVLESAGDAVSLINDLLDLSRLDEDRLRPEFQTIGAIVASERAFGRVTPAAEARSVRLVRVAPPPPIGCWTDGHRLEQILHNVLANAVRHTPVGSTVTLTISLSGDRVEFEVRDQGPGVAADRLEEIFDLYHSDASAGAGIGLGLPLSRRLARLLGGDLIAEHDPAGGGVFRLRLPAAPGEQ
ncbi:MAG TPA: GAF domain-containing sensor histidine kinase [Gemmatimonadales bacterium]|nr:GAF domain-containing sensor histidine kinase [Gemmatimonadales bacterium]